MSFVNLVDSKTQRAALKYQIPDTLENQFGGHGFKGLNYIYHAKSEAEIQWWAVVEE